MADSGDSSDGGGERERRKQELRQQLGVLRAAASGAAAAWALPSGSAGPRVLDELVPGEARATAIGMAYVVRRAVRGLPGGAELERRFAAALADPAAPLQRRFRAAGYGGAAALRDAIVLDIETAGLGNVPVFLIGTLAWEPDGLTLQQFLARDYAEEAAALALWRQASGGRQLLITFNGKSFDLPSLRLRATLSRVAWAWDPWHLDLLHESRRVWGRVLPDCRLQTLERCVCRRFRGDDIPGAQIPAVYHHYVHTGDARLLARVVDHNAEDLLALAELLLRLPDLDLPAAAAAGATDRT